MEQFPFPIKVGEKKYSLEAGKVVSVLFRKNVEVDYLAIDIREEGVEGTTLRIFNNQELTRWLAGIDISTLEVPTMDGHVFRDEFGWNSAVVIKNEPSESELEWYTDVQMDGVDKEWKLWSDES